MSAILNRLCRSNHLRCGSSLLSCDRGRAMDAQLAALKYLGHGRHYHGIKLGGCEGIDDTDHILRIHSRLVRTVGSHGIESVRHHDYARHQRDLIALKAMRVAAPVQRLVME